MPTDSNFDVVLVPRLKLLERGVWCFLLACTIFECAVADILLWMDTKLSGAVLLGMTVSWFLFEVFQYSFVTLISYLCIISLLWCLGAHTFIWKSLPSTEYGELSSMILTLKEVYENWLSRICQYILVIFLLASGDDLPRFFMAISSLYLLSVIGSYFSFLNLLYFGFVALKALPFLYRSFKEEVDRFTGNIISQTKKCCRNFEARFLSQR